MPRERVIKSDRKNGYIKNARTQYIGQSRKVQNSSRVMLRRLILQTDNLYSLSISQREAKKITIGKRNSHEKMVSRLAAIFTLAPCFLFALERDREGLLVV